MIVGMNLEIMNLQSKEHIDTQTERCYTYISISMNKNTDRLHFLDRNAIEIEQQINRQKHHIIV
uniref:Uncharacterized protein n=1 Tax=Arion vulgaris TaxID=1028688 RepID=A0A0B6ZAD6_9EUPU